MYRRMILEILLIFLALWASYRFLAGAGVFRGLFLLLLPGILLVAVAAEALRLETLQYLLDRAAIPISIGALLVLQPELRKAVARIGHMPILRRFLQPQSRVLGEIARAARNLAARRNGALIAIERTETLGDVAEGGTRLDAEITRETLETIFWPGTPLHDLGTVIREGRIAAAGCIFPLSERTGLPTEWGSRHRAALGMTEETDAVVLLVSEETGNIEIAVGGEIGKPVDPDALEASLREALEARPSAAAAPEHAPSDDASSETERRSA
mgnify:CR=1 FL=1